MSRCWTSTEATQCAEMAAAGTPHTQIGVALDRTEQSVTTKLHRMRLVTKRLDHIASRSLPIVAEPVVTAAPRLRIVPVRIPSDGPYRGHAAREGLTAGCGRRGWEIGV